MKNFLDENFLLTNETAKTLFHKYAEEMPIFDYHCHLVPEDIYKDRKFDDLVQVWIADGSYGDHYKWRLMRANGVDESYITGSKSPIEKYNKWVETISKAIGNPIYHWCHLELQRFFDINLVINEANKEEIYKQATKKLQTLTARKLIEKSNVKVICTTDDPVDDLKWHILLKEDKSFKVKVLPAFRPDKAINIELDWFIPWVEKLSQVSNIKISNLQDFEKALLQRIDFFQSVGCKISDHALDMVPYQKTTKEEVNEILVKRLNKKSLTFDEVEKFKTYMLVFFGKEYHKRSWAQQYHINAMRNNNTLMFNKLGPDTGYDAISDTTYSRKLSALLDELALNDSLPKTVLYSLNPNDNEVLASLAYCFQKDVPGKIQLGSAWWFNDHIEGMTRQIKALSNLGLLNKFVGMLTDSRSFLSYPRHEYFRRILCNYLGTLIENGEFPNDVELVGKIVQDICYNNACNYFDIQGA